MKCVKLNSGKIERISDEKAEDLVNHGSAKFIPKSIWKKETRNKPEETKAEEIIDDKDKSLKSVKGKKRKILKTEII